ncbi:hypothetical protein CSA56_12525 [candidate division KSB3 bacterium]|uniref:Novel STAND NTPase 1 domain-containing protein n=1 Tax=candidate division KSB3 bacterium TaxID=2044937 RepID=A0A2G6KCA2_9BACT|nr:MAG: hypothetical protein CSA56_12525 [candidate division KSB3 bacterium]
MRHFAFPNVEILNQTFIGCGRYAVAFDVPGDDYSLPASIVINKATVERAVALLTYEAGSTGRRLYEKKDRLAKKYVGESMHLAYFLALIHRFRNVKVDWRTDIWCTGSITIADGDHPLLQEAGHEEEFTLKLTAFLAETNPDTLFLVPADNIVSSHRDLCEADNARLLSLKEFQRLSPSNIHQEKYVVTILPDELDDIIRVFFAPDKNPYKGLETFGEDDSGQFFGRAQIVQTLWETFTEIQQVSHSRPVVQRFMTILGPSGSGKSSLIQAGLLPILRERPLPNRAASRVVLITTGPHPIGSLARALADLLYRSTEHDGQLQPLASPREVAKILKQPNKDGEYDGLKQIITMLPDSASRPFVLAIDQGGEIYSQCQDRVERYQFIRNILSASAGTELPISVVMTLRSDFLEQTQSIPDFNNAIVRNSVLVPVMNRTDLREVIELPAQRAGYRFSPEIVDQLIAETEGYIGALPLLEFTLTLLWEDIVQGIPPEDALKRIGGVGGALADRAEKLYSTLEPGDRRIARKVFIDLVCPGEVRNCYTRKRLLLSDIATYSDYKEQVLRIVRTFSESHTRLVTLSVDSGGNTTAEITHEALIIRWGRLRSWLEIDREFHTWRKDLAVAIRQWEHSERDDGALLHGILLAKAQEWLEKRPYDLSTPEQEYIRKSQEAFHREEERWKRLYERERLTSLDAYHSSSRALFAAHDELGALIAALKAGKIAQQLELSEKTKRPIVAVLRDIVYGIHESNRLEGHNSPVESMNFSSDNTLLATGSYDGTIKLWKITDGTLILTLHAHSDIIRHVCFSPDGSLLASTGDDARIRLWNVEDGTEVATLIGHTKRVYSLCFHPDGGSLFSGGEDTTIRLWNLSAQRELARLDGHEGSVFCLACRLDGLMLASGGDDMTIKLWNIEHLQEMMSLPGHQHTVRALAFHPKENVLASGSDDRTVKLWNLSNGKTYHTLRGHVESINSVTFSPDGSLLASGSSDKTLKLWNVSERSELASFATHQDEVLDVKFSSDGTVLASGSWDTTVKLWKRHEQLKITILRGSYGHINTVCFHPTEPILASGGRDDRIIIWDYSEGRKIAMLSGHSDVIQSLAVSPDGRLLASGSEDHSIKLWDVKDGRLLRTFSGHTDTVLSVAFSPDSCFLASGSADCTIKLWNIDRGRELFTCTGHTEAVWSVAFHPQKSFLVSGGGGKDNSIRFWNMEDGLQTHLIQVPNWPPAKSGIKLAFSPDGKCLASGSNERGAIILWDAETFNKQKTLLQHTQTILSLAFSPDSALLASGSKDNTVKIFDVATGREITTLRNHSNDVRHVTFSPDGRLLASGGLDNTIRLWNVVEQCHFHLDELIDLGCQWVQGYLLSNSSLSEEDRSLCDEVVHTDVF